MAVTPHVFRALRPADIAVVIPAFNSSAYLGQALASVAGQRVMPGSVILADDGSVDDTVAVARRWQGRLPLEIIRQRSNHGPAAARHRAIQAAREPLLAMLDADDLVLPDHLETMFAAHVASPGLVSAREMRWVPGAGLEPPARPHGVKGPPSSQLNALLRRNFVNFGFFSRELYEGVGGFRDYHSEDWDLWIRMVRAGARLTVTSHPTAIHRVRPDSRSADPVLTAQGGIAVLTAALRAARSPGEAAAARAGLRALRGKLSFYRAADMAARRHGRRARRVALAGLPAGGARDAVGLLAFAVAPVTSARLEYLTRSHKWRTGARQRDADIVPGAVEVHERCS